MAYQRNQSSRSGTLCLTVSDLSDRYLWLANAVDQLMADEQLQGLSQFSSDENGTVPLGSSGTVVWTLGDQQGTIKDLAVTENGTTSIVTHRIYDSYGNLISSSGTVDCLFGYTGFAWDKGSETYQSQTRPYDPLVGRWIQEDLIGLDGCDTNVNRYCGNSPTNATDPSGMWPGLGGDPTISAGTMYQPHSDPVVIIRPLTDREKDLLSPYFPQAVLDRGRKGDITDYRILFAGDLDREA